MKNKATATLVCVCVCVGTYPNDLSLANAELHI